MDGKWGRVSENHWVLKISDELSAHVGREKWVNYIRHLHVTYVDLEITACIEIHGATIYLDHNYSSVFAAQRGVVRRIGKIKRDLEGLEV